MQQRIITEKDRANDRASVNGTDLYIKLNKFILGFFDLKNYRAQPSSVLSHLDFFVLFPDVLFL